MLAGKTLLSPLFPLFCNCFPPFFSPPPFLVLFFPLLFFLTLFLRSSSLVRSFHRVETSPRGSITRLFSPLPPSAAAFRLFALLRVVNRVATACKTDYAPFQLLPLEILDKSLIDLPSPLLWSCFRSRTIRDRFEEFFAPTEFFHFLFSLSSFLYFESERYLKRVNKEEESNRSMARSLSLGGVIVCVPSMEEEEEECEVFPVRSIRLRVLSDRSPRTSVFKIVLLPVFFLLFPPPLAFSFSLWESLTGRFRLKQIHLSRYLKLQYDFDNRSVPRSNSILTFLT